MKNTLEGINSRLDEAEGSVSDLEYKVAENTQLEQQKESKKGYSRASGITSDVTTSHHRGTRRRERSRS